METLEYDYTAHQNRFRDDNRLFVRFYSDILPDEARTRDEGRPVFRDVTMIQIMVPGDKKNIIIREVRMEDKTRFAPIWDRYHKGESEPLDGFPLKEWGQVTRSQIEELKYFGFHTVEHVANAADTSVQKMPGLQQLQQRAKAWLAMQKSTEPLDKLNAEVRKRTEENAAMKAQMEEMAKTLAELKATQSKGK